MAAVQRATITFSQVLFHEAKAIAASAGVSFPEYLRHLIVEDIKERERTQPVYYMSDATEKAVLEGRKEYEEGKTKGFRDIKKLMDHLTGKDK